MTLICSICLDNLKFSDQNISVLKCGHIFHHDCLKSWIQIRHTCPDCRRIIDKNSFIKKVYPKISEDNTYNDNSFKSKVNKSRILFDLLTKNNECSQKAVRRRIVELEMENQNLENELKKLNGEVGKLHKNLEISQNNIRSLDEENCNLKSAVERLETEKNKIAKSVDEKVRKAVEPYLQMRKSPTPEIQLPNMLINVPSTSKGWFN